MQGTLPSNRYPLLLGSVAFAAVMIVGYGSDLVLLQHPGWMVTDDIILATAAAVIVYYYEKQRGIFLAEKVRIIRDMNSFIRNELQVLYASVDQPEKTRLSTIQRIVEHIEWALRELLTGRLSVSEAPSQESPSTGSLSRTA